MTAPFRVAQDDDARLALEEEALDIFHHVELIPGIRRIVRLQQRGQRLRVEQERGFHGVQRLPSSSTPYALPLRPL